MPQGFALFLRLRHNKKMRTLTGSHFSAVAEAKGFEPLWACTQTVFKTASL